MDKIKYFIMDVDGTLTDGKIYMSPTGEAMKGFNIKDGYGISNILIPSGIKPVIITGRKSKIVLKRCKELKISNVYQNISDKMNTILLITNDLSKVAYIGDDLNDLLCMKSIVKAGGVVACPFDAVDELKEIVSFVCSKKGGEGCVREFIEWCIKNEQKD